MRRTQDIIMSTETEVIHTPLHGYDLVNDASLNKGTAFTDDERHTFGLHGLLPPHVGSLEQQVARRLKAMRELKTDFQRYAFLRELQDTNETLFYALLVDNLEELLPLVYTPTVGEGCQRFSEIWRKPRGIFLSYPNRHRIQEILADPRFDRVRVIVVTDGERILGLGDQGAGGLGISIGKLALYTGCAGIAPAETLPIVLDVGTNNQEHLDNPLYVGWRHRRIAGEDYDAFVETFVSCVQERWPNVLLQWEDFAGGNAARLLDRYRDRLCTFNDDIQSTAAVAVATLMAAIKVTGVPLAQQRIALLGPGSAGCGILNLLVQAMLEEGVSLESARNQFYAIGRNGLLVEGMGAISAEQAPFVRKPVDVATWKLEQLGHISLLDVVENVQPTVLIGVSGQPGAFDERTVRTMASYVDRPIVFPLSNPTSRSEATAEQLVAWTDGRALIGTGSPFDPVAWKGNVLSINQTNNSYIFPGMGLGVLASGARRVSDAMFMVACKVVAAMSPAHVGDGARLLPPVNELREVALQVAKAVAIQAQREGLAPACDTESLDRKIAACLWKPRYYPYEKSTPTP
jgi:malate dehydrogenase (oxaloacetate-decarboxylating)